MFSGCYLKQLAMRKFDVKKNYFITKDFAGWIIKILMSFCRGAANQKIAILSEKQFIIL
jgi:hypothetical protein